MDRYFFNEGHWLDLENKHVGKEADVEDVSLEVIDVAK